MIELSADQDGALTVSASVFKARCLEIFKALEQRRLTRVTVTRRGKPVAELIPPRPAVRPRIWGCHRGSVRIPPGVDLTEPVLDEPLDAELIPPQPAARPRIWGCHRGSVRIPPGVDLTEPVLDELLDAELGILHR